MKIRGWTLLAAVGVGAVLMGAGQPPRDHPVREKVKEHAEDRGSDPLVQKYREEFKQEIKEHPRLAHSLVELHVTKEHLKNAPHDFGGHKAAAIAAVDEAIKQIREAMKFDGQQEAKHEEKHEGGKPDHEKHKKDK